MSIFTKSHFKQVFMHWYQRANPEGFDDMQDPAFKISGDTAVLNLSETDLNDLSPALVTLYSKAVITISLRLSGKKVKVAFKFAGVARNDMDLDRDAEDFDEPLQESTKMSAYIKAL